MTNTILNRLFNNPLLKLTQSTLLSGAFNIAGSLKRFFSSAVFDLSFSKVAIVTSWSDFVIWRSRIETSILSLAESLFLVIYNSTPPRFVNCQLASRQISICFGHESIRVMLRDTIRVKIKLLYLLSSLRLTTPTSSISPVMTVKVFVS